MLENRPEPHPRSAREIFLGFLLGILISVGCLLIAIFLGTSLARGAWLFPLINGLALVATGIIALTKIRDSSYALGIVIAIALVFLLNGACAVVLR